MPRYEDKIREKIADWHFLGSQRAFTPNAKSFEKHRSYVLGFRGGKTSHLLRTAILLSYFIPDNEGFVGRATGESLKQFVTDPFFDVICPPSLIVGRPEAIGQTGKKVTLRTIDPNRTSSLLFNYIHDPQSGKFHLSGGNWGFFAVSQAEEINRDEYMKLISRLSRNVPRTFALTESNHAGSNWIFEDFFQGGDYNVSDAEMAQKIYFKRVIKGNHLGINGRSEENRISNGGFVADDYFDELRRTYSPQWQARYLDGSFDDYSGRIYPDYSHSSVHNIEPFKIPEHWPWIVSIDPGGGDPWSIGVHRVDEGGNVIRTKSFYKANCNLHSIYGWMRDNIPLEKARFIIDPENGQVRIQLRDELNVYTEPADKARYAGIQQMASYFYVQPGLSLPAWYKDTQPNASWAAFGKNGSPRYFMVKGSSPDLSRELLGYIWDEKNPNEPKKNLSDHALDDCRYVLKSCPSASDLPSAKSKSTLMREKGVDETTILVEEYARKLYERHSTPKGIDFGDSNDAPVYAGDFSW